MRLRLAGLASATLLWWYSPLLATITFLMGLYSTRRTFGEAAGAVELRRTPRSLRPPRTVRNFSICGGQTEPRLEQPWHGVTPEKVRALNPRQVTRTPMEFLFSIYDPALEKKQSQTWQNPNSP
jgi:membrane glycosyltransferase